MRPFVFLLLSVAILHAEPVWMGSFSSSAGEKLIWQADSTQVEQTPSWSGSGPCPFDVEKLTSQAMAYAKGRLGEEKPIKVDAIYIQRANKIAKAGPLVDKWFLTISFNESGGVFPGSVRILPDGTIIEPAPKT